MGKFDGILFLSDMDGTLLHNAKLSEENRKAIEYFTENGGLFTVATGRAPEFIKKFNLKINAPIISINGTIIYDLKNEHIIKDYFLMPEMIDAAKFAAENLPVIRFSFFLETSEMRVLPDELDFEKVKGTLRKVVFVFETETEAISAKERLYEKFGYGAVFERSWPTGVEMRPKNGGKGVCLKFLKEYMGIKTTVAAGDYENDLSLLEAADISFAPANAIDEIKKIADKTVVSCEEHAISDIIYNLL